MNRALPSLLLIAVAASLTPNRGWAQRVLGPGPDAVTIPRGTLRTTIAGENVIHRGRWNDGESEDLGAGFTIGGLAGPQLSWLNGLDQSLNAIGVSGANASLGETRLELRQRLAITRLGLEFGVADWLTISVDAPFVRARAEAQLRAQGDSGLASAGTNPYFVGSGVPASNRTAIDQFSTAATSLATRQSDCQADALSHPECPEILAEAAAVNALIAGTQDFATGLATIYGAAGLGDGLPYVPLAGSAAEQALQARVAALSADLTRYGVTDVSAGSSLPLAAQAPLSADQLRALVADSANGYGARPMTTTARQDLGDVDVGIRLKLFDSFRGDSARLGAARFGIRQTLGVTYRLGGGLPEVPDNFIDLGTGSGHDALGLRSFTDLVVSDRFWTTVIVGWARGAAHERELRVPSVAGVEWLEHWRTATVAITPGAVLDLRIAPRFVMNDYFAFGAAWHWRFKAEDEHRIGATSVADPLGVMVPLRTDILDAQSAWNEQRFAWTVSYSTVAAQARGQARLPIEIGYTHEQSNMSNKGIVPRQWTDRVQIRYYTRLFGR